MNELWISPCRQPLRGSGRVPGDKSIGHRALLFGALCDGPVEISGLSQGEDNRRTRVAIAALGASVVETAEGRLIVHGGGLAGLQAPGAPIDCGNSGTTMRLLTGLLAAQPFAVTLEGDESLSRRPMGRVAEPLRRMGARIEGVLVERGEILPPLRIEGPRPPDRLRGGRVVLPVASAQVKSALLLAGLYADGPVVIEEPGPSRDHSERLLLALGAPLACEGLRVTIDPSGWDRRLHARPIAIPGDLSSAAFLLGAALVVPGSEITVEGVLVNPTRTGLLDALRAMGAAIEIRNERSEGGEPVADLTARASRLRGVELAGDVVLRAIDEVPLLAALAALAEGTTVIRDARELRVKESDRLAAMARELRALGARVEEREDGLVIEGTAGGIAGGRATAHGDHRVAMSCAIAALHAIGDTVIEDARNVSTSFPEFAATLARLGAPVRDV